MNHVPQGNAKTWTFTRPLAEMRDLGLTVAAQCRPQYICLYHIILYYTFILYIYIFIYLFIYLFIFVSFSFHHHFVDISIIFQPSEKSSPVVVCLELWILVVRSSMPPPRTRPQVRLFGRPTWKTASESQGEFIYWSTCRMTAWIPGCHHTLGPMGRHRWHMGQSRAK